MQDIKDGAALETARFGDRQDTLDEERAMVGLSAVRHTPPQDGMTERPFGNVMGRFDAGGGDEAPQGDVQGQQMTTGLCRGGARAEGTFGQPMANMALNGWKFRQELPIRQGAVADARPQSQQVLGL